MSAPIPDQPASAWVACNALAVAIRDGLPVTGGHTLIGPRWRVPRARDVPSDSMAALVAAAFSWDFARVATRSLGDLPPEDFGWGWHLSGDDHNDVAHGVTADARAAAAMGDSVAAPMAQLAHRVLEQIPDSDGRSQMAHTLIVWARETRDGWHGHQNRNAVTAGGAGRGDTGRHLRFADRASSPFLLALPDGTSSGGDGPTGTCGSACPRGWGSPMASSA